MKHVIVILGLFLMSSTLLLGQGESYYYKYRETQPLDRHDDEVCVKFMEGITPQQMALELEGAGVLSESASEVGRNLYTFTLQSGPSLETVVDELRNISDVSAAHPVYSFSVTDEEVYLTDELCVQFLPGTPAWEIENLVAAYSLIVRRQLDVEPYYLFTVQSSSDALEVANAIALESSVLFSHPNFYTTALVRLYTPTDRYFDRQFNFYNHGQQTRRGTGTAGADIKMLQAWDISRGSSSIQVTVIDDGLDLNHEDISSSKIVGGYDFADNDNNVQPVGANAHGTHCSGLIAADHNTIGVAGISPNSKLQMMKIFRDNGQGGSNDDVARAIDSARTQGADVMSNSWGFNSSDTNLVPAIRQAIIRAKTLGRGGKGCVVVFAAGNTANRQVGGVGYITFPASMPQVITVAASTRNDSVAYYSPNSTPSSNRFLDLAAPSHRAYASQLAGEGFEIWSTDISGSDGYNAGTTDTMAGDPAGHYSGSFGGTSAACPQVAGASALILALDPNLTAEQVRNILNSTADTVGGYNYQAIQGRPGASLQLGYGRMNVYRALLAAVPQLSFQFINRIQGAENYGTLVIDNDKLNPVPSGSSRSFTSGTDHVVRTNELPFRPDWNGTGSTEKHHRFYLDSSDFSLNHQFAALPQTPQAQRAVFQATSPATITTDLIDAPGTSGGNIQLRDPWRYYKDQNDDWWQSNEYIPYGAPFVISNNSLQSYGGVFLNQPIVANRPYYSVGAPNPNTINGLTSYFLNWTGHPDSVSYQSTFAEQTGVVFKLSGAMATARYKAHLGSSTSSATSPNSQRKMVKLWPDTTPESFLYYTSAGEVWATRMAAGTSEWGPEFRVSDGSGTATAPSVAANENDGEIYCVYRQGSDVYFREQRLDSHGDAVWLDPVQLNDEYPAPNAHPVITYTHDSYNGLMVFWEGEFLDFPHVVLFRSAYREEDTWVWNYLSYPNEVIEDFNKPSITHQPDENPLYWMYLSADNESDVVLFPFGGTYYNETYTVPASAAQPSFSAQVSGQSIVGSQEEHRIHVAWEAVSQAYPPPPATDAGDTWVDATPPERHIVMYQGFTGVISGTAQWTTSDAFVNGSSGHFYHPTITHLANGTLLMAWDDGSATYQAVRTEEDDQWRVTEVYDNLVNPNFTDAGREGPPNSALFVATGATGTPYGLQFGVEVGDAARLTPNSITEQYSRRIVAAKIAKYRKGQPPPVDTTAFFAVDLAGITLKLHTGSALPVSYVPVNDVLPGISEENAWVKLSTVTFTMPDNVDSILIRGLANVISPQYILDRSYNSLRLAFDLIDAGDSNVIERLGNERIFGRDTAHVLDVRASVSGLAGRAVYIRPKVLGVAGNRSDISYSLVHVRTLSRENEVGSSPALAKGGKLGLGEVPTEYALHQNYPNPFNPTTQISFDLPEPAQVSLVIYDVLGREVTTLVREELEAGYHSATWNASNVASGVYFARFTATDAAGVLRLNKVSKLLLTK